MDFTLFNLKKCDIKMKGRRMDYDTNASEKWPASFKSEKKLGITHINKLFRKKLSVVKTCGLWISFL